MFFNELVNKLPPFNRFWGPAGSFPLGFIRIIYKYRIPEIKRNCFNRFRHSLSSLFEQFV
jgi:hypothetical protein